MCSRALLNSYSVEKTEHISDMKQGFPVSGFGVPEVDDAHELSRRAFVPQNLVQVSVLEAGVRARLPVGRDRRIAIRIFLGGCILFDIDAGRLFFHAMCSTMFRIRRTQDYPPESVRALRQRKCCNAPIPKRHFRAL